MLSEVSQLFDALEAELSQITAGKEGKGWDQHQVMVCEMIRLRMKRVLEELNRLGVDLGPATCNQRKLGKPQILCFGFFSITPFHSFSKAFESA